MDITKEGVQVKVGQVWQDLDRRYRNDPRFVRVVGVGEGIALIQRCDPSGDYCKGATTNIKVARMHNHSSGFSLVKQVSQQAA